MKMQVNSRVWNLGDTSFRRKRLLDDYIELLKVLDVFNSINPNWDKDAQKAFHLVLLNTMLLYLIKLNETSPKKPFS